MSRFSNALRRFHTNESGESSSLANVFTLTIGALVMFGVYKLFTDRIAPWVDGSVADLESTDFTQNWGN